MAEPGSRYAMIEFIAHVERIADGTLWLETPGGASNAVGVWLKYLRVSLSHLLGLTREAPPLTRTSTLSKARRGDGQIQEHQDPA